ncbi:MAG: SagB/ThcOx family dehydrogenase [Sedimentisphaerales bacterium]|nr:SagB/ThcOx family dehydrogenase [Sedimentisphaerales bacterium]
MNRRTFLKTVPALTLLAAAETGLTQDPNTDANSTPQLQTPIQADEVIKLNPPDLNGGISLMQALKKRKTERNISDKKLTLQQLSDLLWAADGVNRPDGKRTSPAAMALYAVDIYVVLPEGVYLYDVAKHQLNLVAKGDYRKISGMQDFVFIAPVNLVYVFNMKAWQNSKRPVPAEKRDRWVHYEVGFISQNVSLYCASAGLGTTVRGMFDEKKLGELIKVPPQDIALTQTVGWPK